jgi:hypothetical protein
MQQGVYQGALAVSRRGMHHHAGRLAYHRQVFILVEQLDWDILRPGHGWQRLRKDHLDLLSLAQEMPLGRRCALYRHLSIGYEALRG